MPIAPLLLSAGALLSSGNPGQWTQESRSPAHAAVVPADQGSSQQSILVAAHRAGFFGASNTLQQIRASLREGDADILEVDLRTSSDGFVFLFHDDTMDKKTTCSGAVEGRVMERLSSCRMNANGYGIAGFNEVLGAVRGRIIVDAEFKTDAVVAPAIALVRKWNAQGWVYFQVGTNRERYRLARELGPEIALQFKAATDADISWAISLHDDMLTVIEMDRDFVTPDRIRRAHAAGKLVSENTWRYQFSEERWRASCDRAFEMGVDIAVTNNASSCADQAQHPVRSSLARISDAIVDRQRIRVAFRSLVAWVHL